MAPGVLGPGPGYRGGSRRSHCLLCLNLIRPLFSCWSLVLVLSCAWIPLVWACLVQLPQRINLPFAQRETRVSCCVASWGRIGFQGCFSASSPADSASLPLSMPSIPQPFLSSMERLSLFQFGVRHFDFTFLFSFKPVSTSSSAFCLHKFVNEV